MEKYKWQYCSLGGVVRVRINSGEDIAHLDELDQKLWTVLSCPVDGMEMDRQTLALIDADKDGKIRVKEIVAAGKWITSVLKDKDLVLQGGDVLRLDQIDTENETGRRLHDSAVQIIKNLGLEKEEISVADAVDSVAIFKNSKFNGDGIITQASADDEELKKLIGECIAHSEAATDRSGEPGVTGEMIDAFYASCADYSGWRASVEADKENIYPYGTDTAAALQAVEAIKDKVSDYFTRCRLISYDQSTADAVSVSVGKIDEIASCPLAKPSADALLPETGINPAWIPAVNKVKSLVPGFLSKPLNEEEWNKVLGSFSAYSAAMASEKGAVVEDLGIDRVNTILAENRKEVLLSLVAQDKALAEEAASIDDVKKLMLYFRDFAKLLNNYVNFSDFYGRANGTRGDFEVGQLYMDQRCCDLCLRVSDMGKHADMPKLSGMFLIYCKCSSVKLGKTMDIVAVLTAGDISDLRAGKNGIFYDRAGNDWDAVITKVVDNPVSISQAFWAPYRKLGDFVVNLINKSAADKDSKITAEMQAKATEAASGKASADASGAKAVPFDIGKFAGIFAALGLAFAAIGSAVTAVVGVIAQLGFFQLVFGILGLILVISGPSCFIAWTKLRKRNLGPVLNANGWAINSKVLVNILFGNKLTFVAKYPKMKINDPYKPKSKAGLWACVIVLLLACGAAAFYFTGTYDRFFGKQDAPQVESVEALAPDATSSE